MNFPGAKGRIWSEWKWFKGPEPKPRFVLVRIPASTYWQAERTAVVMGWALARLQAMAAGVLLVACA